MSGFHQLAAFGHQASEVLAGRERTIRFRAPERRKPTFVVTRRAAAPDPKQTSIDRVRIVATCGEL